MGETHVDLIDVLKALADHNRLTIIYELRGKEYCACELLEDLPISQSTLSHHLKILQQAGVVLARREGRWTYYRLNEVLFQSLSDFFKYNDFNYNNR